MSAPNYILEYWEKIQSGEIQACRRLKQQYQQLVDEIEHPRDPWVFDIEKANRPIEFIERFCKHSKGKWARSEEHTSELQSRENLVCRLLLEKKKKQKHKRMNVK